MANSSSPRTDANEGDRARSALRIVAAGAASGTGEALLHTLVEHFAKAVGMRDAFVAEFIEPGRARTLSRRSGEERPGNLEFQIAGTPCEELLDGAHCCYASGVAQRYPQTGARIERYLGASLRAHDGRVLGALCAFDARPQPADPIALDVLRIFAARAAAELERAALERELRDTEERLRDLFDEAPIAYVHERLDSSFLRANRAARAILGISKADVPTVVGRDLVAATPDAQRRFREAFESVGNGTDTSGVVLELRRKDDGRPVWVEWWSKPDPGGSYTRTMFIDVTERVLLAQEKARLRAQHDYLLEEIKSDHNFEEIIGTSAAARRVLDGLRRVARTDSSVLISGESGTGKELIARAIHFSSRRADKPFIKVNCAALATSLIESELFGHERGAFSGAIQRRIGRFELANAGTIFLDEIGEVPIEIQVKLLRVLQEREFERVGGNQTIRTDVRVIAATNRDLGASIRDGHFRADLFYRLNVFPIHLPPLREREADIPLLTHFFVQRHAPRIGRRIESVDAESMTRLMRYPWPGNIRELENVIERALILGSAPVLQIGADVLPDESAAAHPPAPVAPAERDDAQAGDLDAVQREHIERVLREVAGVIEGGRGAAVRLGMKPATLRHRMRKLGIARHAGA